MGLLKQAVALFVLQLCPAKFLGNMSVAVFAFAVKHKLRRLARATFYFDLWMVLFFKWTNRWIACGPLSDQNRKRIEAQHAEIKNAELKIASFL